MKASDVRISNIKELQKFLTENNVPFAPDANRPKLQELARAFIESHGTGAADSEKANDENKEKTEEEMKAEEDAVIKAKESEAAAAAAGLRADEAEKEGERARAAKAKEKEDAEKAEAAKVKPTKVKHDEVGKPGARRESSLDDLLKELAAKGFENKQQLADTLEAEVRERKALELVKKEHDEREEAIFAKEMKLEQRIKDNEKEMAQILVHKKQCEEMVEKAVALNARNRA